MTARSSRVRRRRSGDGQRPRLGITADFAAAIEPHVAAVRTEGEPELSQLQPALHGLVDVGLGLVAPVEQENDEIEGVVGHSGLDAGSLTSIVAALGFSASLVRKIGWVIGSPSPAAPCGRKLASS